MKPLLSALLLATPALSQNPPQTPLIPNPAPGPAFTLDTLPRLGFGTWNLKELNTSEAVSWAIQVGYRHIDAAAIYGNEAEVGAGIADGLLKTGLRREDLWITSKLWNSHHSPSLVPQALTKTLTDLGISYLDLYHMHWPVSSSPTPHISFLSTWAAMTSLLPTHRVRHLGVCNFSPSQLSTLLNHTSTPPAVHQMEMHPYLAQNVFLEWHRARGIHVTAYSPLAGTNPTYGDDDKLAPLLKNAVVRRIAGERACSPAQVVLGWAMSRKGTSAIPKSGNRDRIRENFESVEACGLEGRDLERIDGLSAAHHRFNNPSGAFGVRLFEGLEDEDGRHKEGRFKGE